MTPDDIKQYDAVLYDEKRVEVFKFLHLPGWETGWKSNSKVDTFTFLHKHFAGYRKADADNRYDCVEELKTNAPLIHEFWEFLSITTAILKGHRLVRCYANGMPYGADGTLHVDDKSGNGFTTIFYPHETWSPNWGGCTEFYDQTETNVIRSIHPEPNRLIVFPGKMKHVGRGITRQCPVSARITLMFKTDIPPTPTIKDLERILNDAAPTSEFDAHVERSLADDLRQEDELLRRRVVHHTRPKEPLTLEQAHELCERMAGGTPQWEPDPLDIATEAHSPPQWEQHVERLYADVAAVQSRLTALDDPLGH